MRRLLLISLLLTTPAWAQQKQDELVFRLTQDEVATIAEALQDRPFKQVVGILNKLQRQFEEQAKKGKPNETGNGQ